MYILVDNIKERYSQTFNIMEYVIDSNPLLSILFPKAPTGADTLTEAQAC